MKAENIFFVSLAGRRGNRIDTAKAEETLNGSLTNTAVDEGTLKEGGTSEMIFERDDSVSY